MNKYVFFAVPFMIFLYFAIKELMSLDETGKNENVEKFITFDELKDDLMKIEIKQRPVVSRIAKASRKKSKVASMEVCIMMFRVILQTSIWHAKQY